MWSQSVSLYLLKLGRIVARHRDTRLRQGIVQANCRQV